MVLAAARSPFFVTGFVTALATTLATTLGACALVAGCSSSSHEGGASGSGGGGSAERREVELLHVSYDPTRELFEAINTRFAEREAREGIDVTVRMSHGGSGRQARAILDGLEADVASLALAYDLDALAREGQLLAPDWATRLPNHASPWYSTIVFVVREGNPKNIHDWADLTRGDVAIITPNPRTSGGARWSYLAAWGWALRQPAASDAEREAHAEAYLRELYRRVPVLDSGARGASTTFARNGIGDVLLTWENEAHLLLAEQPGLAIVTPSESILAEPPIAVVDRNVDRHHTRDVADAYVHFLYEDEAQEIGATHHFRPRSEAVAARHRGELPDVRLFTIDDVAGSWSEAHARHFADGGLFDRISAGRADAPQ